MARTQKLPTKKSKSESLKRTNRIALMLNDEEVRTIISYMKKRNITNKSMVIRESAMRYLLKELENERPTLFD